MLAAADRIAGRVCLQAILPALKRYAGRIRPGSGGPDELRELLLAAAWEAICSYPLSRQRRVAANLVLQVLHDTTRELARSEGRTPGRSRTPAGSGGAVVALEAAELELAAAAPPRPPLGVDGLVAGAVHRGVVGGREAELILRSRVDGERLGMLAAELGVGYGALRRRRARAEARLRAALANGRACPSEHPAGPYLR